MGTRFRKPLLYPLSYGGAATSVRRLPSYTRAITGILGKLKQWFGGVARDVEVTAEGGEPVERGEQETSTNAQVAGASGEPWPENE